MDMFFLALMSFIGALLVMAASPHLGVWFVGCQSACNAIAVSCYAAAGYLFGTVTAGAFTPPAIIACNKAQGACMAACWW